MLYGHSQDLARAMPFIREVRPAYWLCIDPPANLARECRDLGVKLVVRHYDANWDGGNPMVWVSPAMFVSVLTLEPWFEYAWAITTPNEPHYSVGETQAAYATWMGEVVTRMAGHGKEVIVGNWGSGHDGYFVPNATYYGAHEYWWEKYEDWNTFTVLRHTKWFPAIAERNPQARLFITEFGETNAVTGGPDTGWSSGQSIDSYLEGIKWYMSHLDRYVPAVFIYQLGAFDDWATFEVADTPIEAYMRGLVQTNPPPPPEGQPVATIQIGTNQYEDVRAFYPDNPPYTKRSLGEIRDFVIHHSVTPGVEQNVTDERNTLSAIYAFHRGNGWPGIGYHAIVFPSGNIYITGGAEDVRYHASQYNQSTYGICLIGDFTSREPTEAQVQRTRQLLGDLSYGLGAYLPIRPHRYFGATACPGDTYDFWARKIDPQIPDVAPPTPTQLALDEALAALELARIAVERAKGLL